MRKLYCLVLILLCFIAVFTPFTFHFIGFQSAITTFLFGNVTQWMANVIGLRIDPSERFTSDSTQLYLLYLVLILVALLVIAMGLCFKFVEKYSIKIQHTLSSFLVYYLALISLKYGLDKLNGQQFYFPEPNLLFTPLGYLDKDILYWSVMGSSPGYLYFLGSIEILLGLLLLFRKTRFMGLTIALITYVQVVAVNFGFDISVKLFSSYLLLITLTLLFPYVRNLYRSLKQQTKLDFTSIHPQQNRTFYIIKSIVLLFIFTESFYPAYLSYELNHSQPNDGQLYGSFEVLNRPNSQNIKRIFIHKDDYFIIQTEEDEFIDFKLQWSMKENSFYLSDYDKQRFKIPFHWMSHDTLAFIINSAELETTPINTKNLPLKQPLFHWTVD